VLASFEWHILWDRIFHPDHAFVLAMWPFYALSVAAIYRLRRSQPHLQRPYKVIGYPVVPAVFVAAAIYLVVNALITDPKWTTITFAVVLAGLPVYYAAFRSKPARVTA